MFVGSNPADTLLLRPEERDKTIIKNLMTLFGAAGLCRINTWPDGLKEICFMADGYCRILHMRNGLVLTDEKRRDYKDSSVLKSCITGTACRQGCGCQCLHGQGYHDDKGLSQATMGHCKDLTGNQTHWRGDTHHYCLNEMYDTLECDSDY